MLEGSFEEEGIPCVMIPWGNGTRSAFGLSLGQFRIYVPFDKWEQAKAVRESFEEEPAPDLKEELLQHRDLWYFDTKTEKKLRKKLKAEEHQSLCDRAQQVLSAAEEVHLGGRIYTCPQGGCHILVKADGVKFWFNSATYEIFV